MKRQIGHAVLVILLLGVRAGWSQAATPEEALEELVTTEDIKVALTHLPPEAQKLMDSLSPDNQKDFAQRLLPQAWLKKRQLTLKREGDGWNLVEQERWSLGIFSIANSIISGRDSLLVLRNERGNGYGRVDTLVSMRLEEGEWRVMAFGNWEPKRLESAEFLRRLTPMGKNEAAALHTIEEARGALNSYRLEHPDIGLPAHLEALGKQVDEHGKKKNSAVMEDIFVQDGYEFQYRLISSGSGETWQEQFTITATPVQFGKTGRRRFYADESGTIRFTNEDRSANVSDDELDDSAMPEADGPAVFLP